MEQLSLNIETASTSKVIASSGDFQIELMEHVGEKDFPDIISISKHLIDEYGEKAILTKPTIHKYFNKRGSLPFIARIRSKIIGFIIGVPIEELSHEPWARLDDNFGRNNTLYTFAFVFENQHKGSGYAKMIKRVYLSWAKKRAGYRYITGHVKAGVSARFSGDIRITHRVDNWQGTGQTFEYYRRDLQPEGISRPKNNPPLATRI